MVNVRGVLILFILFFASSAFGTDFETDGWPGEGIPSFSTKNSFLNLYSFPTTTSNQIKYNLEKGTKIVFDKSKLIKESKEATEIPAKTVYFDESKLITTRSVTLRAKSEIDDIYCKDTGKIKIKMPDGTERFVERGTVPIVPGDTIEYLQDRPDGYITVKFKGNICEVFIGGYPPKFDGLEKQPVVEWWIKIVDENKMPKGWLLYDKSQVNYLETGF